MATLRVGDETWDLVGAEGVEVHLPPESKPEVDFPSKWTVFGPWGAETTECRLYWARPLADADLAGLTEVPQELSLGGESRRGREVVLGDDGLNFEELFGGHETGRQAYAMAEVQVSHEADMIIGAGADWWMQWWIDGQPVYDTLETANVVPRIGRMDHVFRERLQPGRHLLAVRVIAGGAMCGGDGWLLHAGPATARDEALVNMTRSDRWEFVPELQEIVPPARYSPQLPWEPTMAIRTDLCLADETIELEYCREGWGAHAGIVFGAQDSTHYYWAEAPHWGQLARARAFHALLCRADGDGYLRNLKAQLVPNVPVQDDAWVRLKVERRGKRIQMWVNGVKGPSAEDDTYGLGRVGIAGFSKYTIRNLKIDGRPAGGERWPGGGPCRQPWYLVEPKAGPHDMQGAFSSLVKLADDEVILGIAVGHHVSCHAFKPENSEAYLYLSKDGGRTWSGYAGPLPRKAFPAGRWTVGPGGVIRVHRFDAEQKRFAYCDSSDKGLTWTEARSGELMGDWERDLFRPDVTCGLGEFKQLRDGSIVVVILRQFTTIRDAVKAVVPDSGMAWGINPGTPQPFFCISRDHGESWSDPAPMDMVPGVSKGDASGIVGDYTETPVALLPSGKLVSMSRPIRAPFMWQTESTDGGRTWRQSCYAPFTGHGGPVMLTTASGYLALITRGPGICVHVSTDEGLNWDEGTMIDFTSIYNGSGLEIDPDVVLTAYPESMDEIRPAFVRVHRIRITPDGPVPD